MDTNRWPSDYFETVCQRIMLPSRLVDVCRPILVQGRSQREVALDMGMAHNSIKYALRHMHDLVRIDLGKPAEDIFCNALWIQRGPRIYPDVWDWVTDRTNFTTREKRPPVARRWLVDGATLPVIMVESNISRDTINKWCHSVMDAVFRTSVRRRYEFREWYNTYYPEPSIRSDLTVIQYR